MAQFDFSLVRQSGDEQPSHARSRQQDPKDLPDSPEFKEMHEARARHAAENRTS